MLELVPECSPCRELRRLKIEQACWGKKCKAPLTLHASDRREHYKPMSTISFFHFISQGFPDEWVRVTLDCWKGPLWEWSLCWLRKLTTLATCIWLTSTLSPSANRTTSHNMRSLFCDLLSAWTQLCWCCRDTNNICNAGCVDKYCQDLPIDVKSKQN